MAKTPVLGGLTAYRSSSVSVGCVRRVWVLHRTPTVQVKLLTYLRKVGWLRAACSATKHAGPICAAVSWLA